MSQLATTGTIRRTRRNYRLLAVAAAVFLAVGTLVFLSTRSSAIYYVTVGELRSKGASAYDQQVRVAGRVLPGSIRHLPDGSISFTAYDSTGRLRVRYGGVVPDIFGPNVQVVVEGKETRGGVFEANTLLAKCPSKFQSKQPVSRQ